MMNNLPQQLDPERHSPLAQRRTARDDHSVGARQQRVTLINGAK